MCVLALAFRSHPGWPLVLAGNRDELHARPAAPLAHWQDAPEVLGGRDLEGGGTWLGVAEAGRLAVVTNLRGFGPRRPRRRPGACWPATSCSAGAATPPWGPGPWPPSTR